jgi:hypothetical protein
MQTIPLVSYGLQEPSIEEDIELMKVFGNSMLDQDHDYYHYSIAQISPRASRSGSPNFQF